MEVIKKFMRISHWWHYKAAPLMAFVYAKAFINHISPLELLPVFVVFFIAIVGLASLGHFINDLADVKEDSLSGKENFIAGMTGKGKAWSAVLLLILSVLPWFYVKTNFFIIVLLILQLTLYITYSFKPMRLKNRHFWGVLADTFYGHIIPALVVLSVFSYYGNQQQMYSLYNIFSAVLMTWLFTKGIRNIILHQIDDRKKDRIAGIQTFVVKFGDVFSLNFINRLILPIEFIALTLLLIFACKVFPYFYIYLAAFIVFTIIKFSLWKVFVLPPRQMRFKFLFFLNDFYEDWLPLIMLVYLMSFNYIFFYYLIIHLVLFPKTVINFVNDIELIVTRK